MLSAVPKRHKGSNDIDWDYALAVRSTLSKEFLEYAWSRRGLVYDPATHCKRFPRPDDLRRCWIRQAKGYEHLRVELRPLKCRKWALRGTRYCSYHTRGALVRRETPYEPLNTMSALPQLYRVTSSRLMQRLEEIEAAQAAEIHLRKELALVRASADSDVAFFQDALDTRDVFYQQLALKPGDPVLKAGLEAAQAIVNEAEQKLRKTMKEVRKAALDAYNIQRNVTGFSSTNVSVLMGEIMRCIHDATGGDLAVCARFEELIASRVRVDVSGKGTTRTPDQDAVDMDSTVPAAPPDGHAADRA